ncbi:MAG: hypothetical protein ACI814_005064, partial [Mariniblastus sp.]
PVAWNWHLKSVVAIRPATSERVKNASRFF